MLAATVIALFLFPIFFCPLKVSLIVNQGTRPRTRQGGNRREAHEMHSCQSSPRRIFPLTVLILLGLSACSFGPDYRRPQIFAPDAYRNQETPGEPASIADLPWWQVFEDPALIHLIDAALHNNYDLRIAVTRIEQARAIAAQVRSQLFPQLGYEADVTRGKNATATRAANTGGLVANSFIGTLNAAWEIDLWGRIRRADEAAQAEILATEEARRGIMVSLVSETAQAYFELLDLDERLAIARRTTESFEQSLKMFRRRLEGGLASVLETARAEAALASAAANVPELERVMNSKENQISVLVGREPGPIPRSTTLIAQQAPLEIPAGLPSLLLERRPDIRQAEQLLVAANARIGSAVAEFFPRLNLTTFFGRVSTDLSALTSGKSTSWSIGTDLAGPIFRGGQLVGQLRQREAEWQESHLRYRQTALNAFQ